MIYSPPLFAIASQRFQFFYSTPEEVLWIGSEEFNKPILNHDVVIKGDFSNIVQQRVKEMEV